MSSVQVNNFSTEFSVPFSGMVLSIEELTQKLVTYLADKYKFSAEEELKEIVLMKDNIYNNASTAYGKNEVAAAAPKKKNNNKKNASAGEEVVVDQEKEDKKAKAALKRAEAKANR